MYVRARRCTWMISHHMAFLWPHPLGGTTTTRWAAHDRHTRRSLREKSCKARRSIASGYLYSRLGNTRLCDYLDAGREPPQPAHTHAGTVCAVRSIRTYVHGCVDRSSRNDVYIYRYKYICIYITIPTRRYIHTRARVHASHVYLGICNARPIEPTQRHVQRS